MPQRSSFFNFDSLFDTSPDAMIVADAGGRIVLANAQAARLFGYSIEQLGTLHVEALIPARFRAGHERHRAGYVAEPRVRPMGIGQELAGLRADGTQFPVEIALSPIDTSDGRRFVASIRDVSETQRARQALVRARYDALVARIGRLVLESSSSQGAFEEILKLIAGEAGFDAVAIVLTNAPHAGPTIRAASGWNAMLDDALPLLLRPGVFAAAPDDATVVTARELADVAFLNKLAPGDTAAFLLRGPRWLSSRAAATSSRASSTSSSRQQSPANVLSRQSSSVRSCASWTICGWSS